MEESGRPLFQYKVRRETEIMCAKRVKQTTDAELRYFKKCEERLKAYEKICESPEQLKKIDDLYLEKCKENDRLRKEVEELKREGARRWKFCRQALPEKYGKYVVIATCRRGKTIAKDMYFKDGKWLIDRESGEFYGDVIAWMEFGITI